MRIAILMFVFPLAVNAEECFEIDPSRSEARFEIMQAGAPFSDTFEKLGGEVCVDDEKVTRIDAWMDPASIETGLPELDTALQGEAFFAVKKYPRVIFTSNEAERTSDGIVAHGTLEMKGVSKPLDLSFTLEKTANGYLAEGKTALQRLDFNIGTGEWSDTQWLSDEVDVAFSIHAN